MTSSNLVTILVPTLYSSEEGCVAKAIIVIMILLLPGVSGRQHSSVGVTTNSEGHLDTKESQAPGFNGSEVNEENSSAVSGTTISNVGNQSDSGVLTFILFLRYSNKYPPS